MSCPLRLTTTADVPLLRAALGYLKQARLRVRAAKAPRTLARIDGCIASIGGAIRHAERAATHNPIKES